MDRWSCSALTVGTRPCALRAMVSSSEVSAATATRVGSSWINQIETWFGIITRQSIRRGTFTSVTVLIKQVRDYIDHWNTDPKPFQWTAAADEILAKVKLVQTNIKKLVDNNAK